MIDGRLRLLERKKSVRPVRIAISGWSSGDYRRAADMVDDIREGLGEAAEILAVAAAVPNPASPKLIAAAGAATLTKIVGKRYSNFLRDLAKDAHEAEVKLREYVEAQRERTREDECHREVVEREGFDREYSQQRAREVAWEHGMRGA